MATEFTVIIEEKETSSWLSASEAYAIMDATLTKEAQKNAVEINNEIRKAAMEGKGRAKINTASFNFIVIKKLVAHLESLGYRVVKPTDYYFYVYWAD